VFTNIDGVTFTATRAQAPSEQPFNLTVAGDSSTTTSNVQAFVDAYNKLKSAVDGLADPGGATSAAGPFAHDAGVKALLSRLTSTLRAPGSPSLASYGIIAARDGTLTLDSARLTRQLAANPTGLDKLIGTSNGSTPTGIAGALDTYLDQWTDTVNGQIKQRDTVITKQQAALSKRQDALQIQYDSAYQRYLKQFTDLQTMQAAMNNNVSMFDAMFSKDKS
jgi:flagellar hook-associated protein 2